MDVAAKVKFAKRDPKQTEKTRFFYSYDPTPGEPVSNIEYEQVAIDIHDVRPRKDTLSLDREGFQILDLESKLQYQDFFDKDKVKEIFMEELRIALLKLLGARGLFFHEIVVRTTR
jgi:hypothetical protein